MSLPRIGNDNEDAHAHQFNKKKMFHGTGLSFQTPVLLHESQMCAQRIVRQIEEDWRGCLG